MQNSRRLQMQPETIPCDVLVAGAGVSGLAAAIAASERGAKTLLIEKNDYIGGTVIAGMHRYLCGLYGTAPSKTLNAGLSRALVSVLTKRNAVNGPVRLGKVYGFRFRPKDLLCEFNARIQMNKKNLKVLLETQLYAITKEKERILALYATVNNTPVCIEPKVVIDASGDGAIIMLSGAKYQVRPPSGRQLAGFSFRVAGIKGGREMLAIKVPYHVRFATCMPLEKKNECIIRMNVPSGADTGEIQNEAKRQMHRLCRVLPEFNHAYIAEFSPSVTEREGLRLQGEYTLTAKDVLSARHFEDGVVKSAWPIELWTAERGPQYRYLEPGAHYEIPLRCLKSKQINNLLACGRCISATHEALGSVRVAGTCISLGEQAGITAVKLCESY
mgnify:CR=1 FL=1